MERIVDYKLVVGVLVVYALLIFFGGMATRNVNTLEPTSKNNYINLI